MKTILFLMCLLGSITGFSQTCTVTIAGPNPLQVCPGTSITLTATGTVTQANQAFDFNNNALPAGWSTSGTANYGVLCGNSLDNTPYFWASTAAGTPQITSDNFDVCSGGTIDFDMKYAVQGGGVPCEGPDEQDEGVSIQYSIDGGATWIEFVYFSPWGFQLPANPGGNNSINGATAYTNWSNFSIPIPPGATTTNTMFRWIQVNSSGGCCDNWGLDNIFINAGPCLTTNVGWDIPGSNTPSSNTITIPIYSDTVIVAGLYDPNGVLLCQSAPLTVTILTPFINGGLDQTVCAGGSVTLAGVTGTNFVWDNGGVDGVPFTPATTQTYTVNGIGLNGCPATDQVLVTVNPANVYTVSYPNPAYCIDAADPSATLSTPLAGAYSIAPATMNINANTGVLDLSTSTTTTSQLYTITFTPSVPCYLPTTTTVTVNALPTVNAGNDIAVCDGAQVTLTATGTAANYGWDQGVPANGSSVTPPLGVTTYTATGTSAQGCINTDSRIVTVNPLPTATITGNTTLCLNSPQPTVTFTGANGTAPYTFSYSYNNGAAIQVVSNAAGVATISIPTNVPGSHVYDLISVQDASSTTCLNLQQGSVTVVVNDLPTATIAGDVTICQFSNQPQVTFTGGNTVGPYTFTYTLNGGAPQTVSTPAGSNNATINAPTNVVGNFVYQLISVQDASSTACSANQAGTATIIINPLPTATIAGAVSLCLNEPQPVVTFQGLNGVAPFIFTYSLNGGANQTISSNTGQATISVPTNVAGDFNYQLISVQESSISGCTNAVGNTILVRVWDLPIVSAGIDYPVCEGFSTTLNGQGAVSYVWDNSVTDGVAFVPQNTSNYTVIGTDVNGCKNTDVIHVTVVPTPQINFSATNLAGCSPLITTLTNQSTGNLNDCQWTLSDGSQYFGCGSINLELMNPGCYDVTLTVFTPEGCTNTGTQSNLLCVYPNPIAGFNLTPDVVETSNTFVNFFNDSYGAVDYQWDFSDGSYSNLENPTHEFPGVEAGYYEVILVAINSDGCTDTVSKTVQVKEDLIYYVPNAFSPDGDEFNHVFKPVLTSGFDVKSYHLQIFNRWGQLVFESLDYEVGWDGTFDGQTTMDGTYSWKIKVKSRSNDKKVELGGHVVLIK
ncbi:gliding motility-associated C-terminal domain-containing protein [Fluviicola taffensis]|uniref:PKD domain containing protein n=1 Tax=Fluviicola taffensis (strain DSM 16823 / NCIMB 13979 / RW262) TaxID=755732 RepID=F2IIM9_FLUTR|nr:gliding motility-associated C-terminal domain-containing protein [Fluviicola taffensis]AEA45991.1 PKD domain containing protein [Fluviicola taffensis DSM 16823]